MLKKILQGFIFAALLAGLSNASFAESEPCYERKAECLEYIRDFAEQGNAQTQNDLGEMYYIGKVVEKDAREALRWFRKAAEQGVADAQFYLGAMYYIGEGVAKDYSEAARWYREAAEQGNAQAQNYLGEMYYIGKGVAKDAREAVRWYRKAAEQGHAIAQFNLGNMYGIGGGVEKDYSESARWLRKAAEQGVAVSQFFLGAMYARGDLAKDYRKAAYWYSKAAEQGFAVAQYYLSVLYGKGNGVVLDYRESYIWVLIAKASGSVEANKDYQKISWGSLLTPKEIKSAKREAARRFEAIENRKNKAQFSDNNSAQKGENIAVAKPPAQTDIAAEVFENIWRSVVKIENNDGQGGGVIIRPNMVATNCHVVAGGDIVVYKPENQRINESVPFSAKVIHHNEEDDFCILEVKGLWGIAATIRKYKTLKVGENVYALGTPRGLDMSLSNGLISQLRTNDGTRFIQTDAAISPGSSGGGLFDTKGNLIGILTSKYVDEGTEGIGFAISADLVLEF